MDPGRGLDDLAVLVDLGILAEVPDDAVVVLGPQRDLGPSSTPSV
jgi:hypothetical protein